MKSLGLILVLVIDLGLILYCIVLIDSLLLHNTKCPNKYVNSSQPNEWVWKFGLTWQIFKCSFVCFSYSSIYPGYERMEVAQSTNQKAAFQPIRCYGLPYFNVGSELTNHLIFILISSFRGNTSLTSFGGNLLVYSFSILPLPLYASIWN